MTPGKRVLRAQRQGRPPGRQQTIGWLSVARGRSIFTAITVTLLVAASVALINFGHTAKTTTAIAGLRPDPSSSHQPIGRHSSLSSPSRSAAPPQSAAQTPFQCRQPAANGSDTPQRLCIPGLRVDASVLSLGLNADQTVQVPSSSQVRDAGWYRYSAQPGAVGPSVILGHVDSTRSGEGVFSRLGTLSGGAEVVVTRGDGKVATYQVTSVAEVPTRDFPTQAVYGPTSGPALRLVTCGNKFDAATGKSLVNIIAYGTLISLR